MSTSTSPTIREEGFTETQARICVTAFITIMIIVLIAFDAQIGIWQSRIFLFERFWAWPRIEYWQNFFIGIVIFGILIWLILYWDNRLRLQGKQSWLRKHGDELGWPLMILAFTIQLLLPIIRPFLLGALLVSSWVLLIWHRKKT
jgi:hypothetical protein